jgi:hypothetical protein
LRRLPLDITHLGDSWRISNRYTAVIQDIQDRPVGEGAMLRSISRFDKRLKLLPGVLNAILCAFLLGSCSSLPPEGATPGMAVRSPKLPDAGIHLNQVVFTDKTLQRWSRLGKKSKIAVESHNARRTPSGTIEVWAVLRNRTDFDQQVEGRVQFFDADRAPAEGPSAWQRVHLPANGVATYREFSTKIFDIPYYYVELKEGD